MGITVDLDFVKLYERVEAVTECLVQHYFVWLSKQDTWAKYIPGIKWKFLALAGATSK